MDPERVHSYLQVACAGLGFDIGEVWWTSNQSGVSTVAAIEEKGSNSDVDQSKSKLRFVQLYTSRSYADQRSKLICPPSESTNEGSHNNFQPLRRRNSTEDLKKHALSPQLVDAIANSTEVIWANCQKQEGLLGRSDVRLQTAVGMPVAMDDKGNMCVVVMFSPNNVQSTDEAMEYLQFISRSATSSSIPCLLPVFDEKHPSITPLTRCSSDESIVTRNRRDRVHLYTAKNLGEGVTTRFVPLDNISENGVDGAVDRWAGLHTDHKLSDAPKDCFGIPMLPSFAELGSTVADANGAGSNPGTADAGTVVAAPSISDAFDEASYGVWTTIMDTTVEGRASAPPMTGQTNPPTTSSALDDALVDSACDAVDLSRHSLPDMLAGLPTAPPIPQSKRVRLEEFCSAFLGMSVFDVADVWVPSSADSFHSLRHVTSVTSTRNNDNLNNFKRVSGYTKIKVWSGAVGRAYASGNPVWSANQDVIVDSERSAAFQNAKIQTALAVPIISAGSMSPSCVLCCYSLVRSDSVPFVLRFVQQALRLLWEGLDQVVPHESVGERLWQGVGPADLGEMAADVEMQQAFVTKKKRPHDAMSSSPEKSLKAPEFVDIRDRSSSLSYQLESLGMTPDPVSKVTAGSAAAQPVMATTTTVGSAPMNDQTTNLVNNDPTTALQYHLQNAVRSIGDAVPWSGHHHIVTNEQGTKRAHMYSPSPSPEPIGYSQPIQQQNVVEPIQSQPLPQQTVFQSMPQPLSLQTDVRTGFASQPLNYTGHYPNNSNQAIPSVSGESIDSQNLTTTLPQHAVGAGTPYQVQSSPALAAIPHPATTVVSSGAPMTNGVVPGAPGTLILPAPSTASGQEQLSFPDTVQSVSGQFCLPAAHNGSAAAQSVATNGKPCRIQGCNEPAVSRRPYCLRHSGNRSCEHAGCTKCAQGSTRFCIAHGGGRRCTFPGCDKGARDKFFCAAHGGGKRCTHKGCTKSAVGGSNLCTSHGGGRRCSVEGCDKSAQSSTKFCVKHGGGKKCAHANCEKVARGRTLYCASHGGGIRCKLEGCNRVAIGKLQLCRTHGGGSRARPPKTSPQLSPATVIPANIQTAQPRVQSLLIPK